VERLTVAIEETDARVQVDGHGVLRVWVEPYDYHGVSSYHDLLLSTGHVNTHTFAHEYGHFLDLTFALRCTWRHLMQGTQDHKRWAADPESAYWLHPGEMVARYVEQLVCPNRRFKGDYSREMHRALLPTFLRMVSR
jgi:hypothetical protein